jgi:hypothetical protein
MTDHSRHVDQPHDDSLRDKAQHAFEASRDGARAAAHKTAEGLDSNPLGVLVGGLALGVVASALIPRTQRERELLAPVGKRLSTTAAAAITAAKETGRRELETRGFTRDGAREQARSLFQNFTEALTQAGTAAAQAAKEKGSAA